MHLISELSDHLKTVHRKMSEDKMVTKKDLSMIESVLFLQAIDQFAGKRKASEALSTSIDTINKYIDSLEQDLGIKLISSSGRGSTLTSAAQKIISKTAKIKEALDDIYNIRLENREIKGEVRVFISLGYASYMVPQDLSSLFDLFPELKIVSNTALDVSAVNVRDIDIALTYEEIDDFDVTLIIDKKVHCGFFASSKYLAEHGYPVDLDDMVKNHRFITKHDSLLKKAIGAEKFERARINFVSNNTLAIINALENNVGIGIMPLSFALKGLVCLDNIICDIPVHYRLYANRNTKDIPRVRTLINFYKGIMDKLENPVPVPSLKGETMPIIRELANK